jgi:CubicO group peptidase (beta-lactamase class C family)
VIEKVTGQGYEAAVKALVLAPIGVSDMTIAGNTLADRLPHEVKYYGQFGEDPYAFNIQRMDSHGGWVATAKDLAALLVKVDGYPDKADILQAATLATMTTPSTANANYACGWAVNTANNWSHIGSLPGTETEIIRTSTSPLPLVALTGPRYVFTTTRPLPLRTRRPRRSTSARRASPIGSPTSS